MTIFQQADFIPAVQWYPWVPGCQPAQPAAPSTRSASCTSRESSGLSFRTTWPASALYVTEYHLITRTYSSRLDTRCQNHEHQSEPGKDQGPQPSCSFWNRTSKPIENRTASDLPPPCQICKVFRQHLKTFLFSRSRQDILTWLIHFPLPSVDLVKLPLLGTAFATHTCLWPHVYHYSLDKQWYSRNDALCTVKQCKMTGEKRH